MIIMEDYSKLKKKPQILNMLGFALIRILKNSHHDFKVIFQKGIGNPLIQNLIELYKKEIIEKRKGNSIIPLDDFTIFIHYFEDEKKDITLIIFMDIKETSKNYANFYLISKEIFKDFSSNQDKDYVLNKCNNLIEVPRAEGIIAVFILSAAGSPYFSKINTERTSIANSEVHISGFISALYSFSQQIICEDSGAKLKEINFGNQRFYMITKNKVIFAYLVEKMNPLLQRYMYLIVDEFLAEFHDILINFMGEVTPFKSFERVLNEYFII